MTRLERRLAAGLILFSALVISRGSPALTGDGTYYLATAHSLMNDRDLDLTDDLALSGGFPFAADAHPGYARRDRAGRLLPTQGLAFSAGIAPIYAAVTWIGGALPESLLARVRWNRARAIRDLLSVSLAALAAWLAVLTLRLTSRVAPDLARPWLFVVLAFITPPLVIAGIQPRPDITAALCIAWFALELTRPVPRPALASLPLALLPWLHMRFSVVAIAGALWLIRRRATGAGLVPLASLAALGGVTWMLFGSWMPPALPDEPPLTVWRWLTTRMVPLVDWDAGLLWVAPFWLVAFAGVDRSNERAATVARWAGVTTAGLLLAAGVFSNGRGLTAPGESLAPGLPVILPLVALAWSRLSHAWSRGLARTAVTVAAIYAVLVIAEPRRAVTEPGDGLGRLPLRGVDWFRARNAPAAKLDRMGFTRNPEGFLAAVRGGHLEALRLYLEDGFAAREGLQWAVAAGRLDSLRVLLDTGAGPSPEGALALARAREFERDALAQALVDAGASLDTADASGETAVMAAVRARRPQDLASLVAAGANVNAAARTRETPLAIAVQLGHADMVRALLDAGADPNAAALDGWTPLISAVRLGRPDLVHTLLAARADPKARTRTGWTALMWAAYAGSSDIVSALLAAGADPNAMSAAGHTPLIRAAGQGHTAIVAALLGAGADPAARVAGASARDWAERNGHAAAAALLPAAHERPPA